MGACDKGWARHGRPTSSWCCSAPSCTTRWPGDAAGRPPHASASWPTVSVFTDHP